MSDIILRVEAVASTILLSCPQGCVPDIRPGLLAAQLSADKQAGADHDPRAWQLEYARVMALLGWRHNLAEQHVSKRQSRSGWQIHSYLARGIARHCSPQWVAPVARALAELAVAPAGSKAMQILASHGWHGPRLDLQVVLLEAHGRMVSFSLGFEARELPSAQWLSHRFAPASAAFPLCARSGVATLACELYVPVVDGLKARLGDRLDTAIATFASAKA